MYLAHPNAPFPHLNNYGITHEIVVTLACLRGALNGAKLLKHMGDSMLRTLHSDTKINILNPNLNVKMLNKGVQTYLESNFSVPFVPNKKML